MLGYIITAIVSACIGYGVAWMMFIAGEAQRHE